MLRVHLPGPTGPEGTVDVGNRDRALNWQSKDLGSLLGGSVSPPSVSTSVAQRHPHYFPEAAGGSKEITYMKAAGTRLTTHV